MNNWQFYGIVAMLIIIAFGVGGTAKDVMRLRDEVAELRRELTGRD